MTVMDASTTCTVVFFTYCTGCWNISHCQEQSCSGQHQGRWWSFYWAACAPSHKMGFRSSAAKNGVQGEGRHEGLVRRNDVLTNGFIWVSLARSLTRILFVPRLRSPWKTQKVLRTWRRLFALFEATRSWESLYNFFIVRVYVRWCWRWETQRNAHVAFKPTRCS